jgi:hypothetical protein
MNPRFIGIALLEGCRLAGARDPSWGILTSLPDARGVYRGSFDPSTERLSKREGTIRTMPSPDGRVAGISRPGLTFSSRVLDVGCGVLRGGRWIIPLLDAEHYCGIEPQEHLIERGLREFVDPAVVELKRPRFDHNDRFDFSPFGVRFTHFMARSVWTHASKPQVERCSTASPSGERRGRCSLRAGCRRPCSAAAMTIGARSGSAGAIGRRRPA